MRTIFFLAIGLAAATSAYSGVCYLSGERVREEGISKVCYYDCMDRTRTITIDWSESCPMILDE